MLIYDTMYGNPEDVLYALESYRKAKELTGDKVLILISHLGTWGKNGKKEKKDPVKEVPDDGQGDGAPVPDDIPPPPVDDPPKDVVEPKPKMGGFDDDDDPKPAVVEPVAPPPEPEVKQPDPSEEEVKEPVYLPWTDKDYKDRAALDQFERIKQIEDMVLTFELETVKTYVICSGLLYGAGEDAMEKFFKSAWLQDPSDLPVVSNKESLVPAVHVNDLSTFVLKISDSPPEQKYHFMFDSNKDRTLYSLLKSISDVAGSGRVKEVAKVDLIKPQHEWYTGLNFWSLNSELVQAVPLKYQPGYEEKPPKDPNTNPDDPDQQADADPPEPEPEDPEFEWHCKKGIADNGKLVLGEFSKQHSRNGSEQT